MTQKIFKRADIWTADEEQLGLAEKIYYREEGANPDLELYESYLEVENFNLGDTYYVPFEFILDEPGVQGIRLSVNFDEVLKYTWTRMPNFVARGEARIEELPEEG